ncbi:MAG TPA: ROK family protein [Opitutaceae bacterium]|nr:ROK family protein [Opitutaceae bacterium]
MNVLGIDIGGSALKGAPVDTGSGRLLAERYRIETPEPLSPKKMASAVARLAWEFRWRGPIGVGFPGVVHGSTIMTSANLDPDFVGCDTGRLFAEATGCRVAMTNDAAAAAMAEMKFGAGRDFAGKVLILTLGTGVGSAVAYQGVVVPFEFGHLPWKRKDAEKHVAASVRENEDLSWHEWGKRLHHYVRLLERVVWPELIVIGGGVSAKHEKFFKYIKAHAPLVPAKFFNEAGIVGAALWGGGGQAQPQRRTGRETRAFRRPR